ncbi:hypothetical protein GCM10027402_22470 [Arthrobacter monumenti]
MHQVSAGDIGNNAQIHAQGLKGTVAFGQVWRNLIVLHLGAMEILGPGGAETPHPQVQLPGQHAAQLGHMHTRPAVDLRWEFFCHNIYTHSSKVVQSVLLI